ncbi:MAG TPA: histidinol-phosphatase [Solirubrobacterales bacterium]|jgi:histidinol-phosphatase (PHP family)
MLTDYHLHLRPDEVGKATEAFTQENADRYLAAAEEQGIAELGVSEHVYRFTDSLEIWRHPYWRDQAVDDLGAYCEFVRSTTLRLGVEADYIRGAEDRIETLLEAHDFDYVVGSVHYLGEKGAVDDQRYDVWESFSDADSLWRTYFEWQGELVRSGLFDIVSHPDLIKIWGDDRPAPERDPRFHYEPFVEALAESETAVEVSTAGLRKPVGEIYPAQALAEMCREAGAEFALSSDAHAPEQVGYGYDQAMEFLDGLAVERICVFEGRTRRTEPIGRTGVDAAELGDRGGTGA